MIYLKVSRKVIPAVEVSVVRADIQQTTIGVVVLPVLIIVHIMDTTQGIPSVMGIGLRIRRLKAGFLQY